MLQADLPDLAAHVATLSTPPPAEAGLHWQGWHITAVGGGRNGRVFRATSDRADVAVKLTTRDARDRAGREYCSLKVLAEAGFEIAPRPLLLDRDRYPTQVVVMTWLDGTVSDDLPATDDAWSRLVEHLAIVHTVTPETSGADLPLSVLGRLNVLDGLVRARRHLDLIPPEDQPPALRRMVERLEAYEFPTWPPPRLSLCRGDPNVRNIVRRPGPWASVDWETSGWGDPACEIAELIGNAAYLDVPAERWDWVRERYASLNPEPGLAARIPVYVTLWNASWATRFGRMLYEIPRGQDVRLVSWPDGWLDTVQANYERYLERALRALE